MKNLIRFRLYRRPVPKQSARFTKGGHSYQTTKVKAEEKAIAWLAKEHAPSKLWAGPIQARVRYHYACPKSWSNQKAQEHVWKYKITVPDLTQLDKLLFDALEGIIYEDDKQIVICESVKWWAVNDCITVELTQL